ncbi:Pkinase-domain-containing protein, partial [Blastocladiella britannica]
SPSPPVYPDPTGPEVYETMAQVGEGTYGKVFLARCKRTGTQVALKRVRIEATRDGFPITAVRELQLLQRTDCANVVSLRDLALEAPAEGSGSNSINNTFVYMVFEYLDHDLAGIMHHPHVRFEPPHIKSLMQQLLSGLAFLHRHGIIHRDIKGSNLLLNRRGELKLADFGLAKYAWSEGTAQADLTNRVITLWYRPPELLLGTTRYGGEVDLWSAGCILVELYLRQPAFPGTDEITQLDLVYRTCGTPDTAQWPTAAHLPWYELTRPPAPLPRDRSGLPTEPEESSALALELADCLLQLTPWRRPTAAQALLHPWFAADPLPMPPRSVLEALQDGERWHEYESKQRK